MMDVVYDYTKDEDSVSTADLQWFYSKSKVPICLAITDSFPFLNKLRDANILSEEEVLELLGDTRNVHRVVYECLCWIEDKVIRLQYFFEILFQKSFLKRYPDLNPIYKEYKEGKYRYAIHSTADQEKDLLIFAKDKVEICLTITDRFPFLHGLQDLTILSESESLKLQADERPVSRVIYESLSLIEKKDLKLNIVFEYIFQQCYLKLYPGLQDILREPTEEFVAPFNGGQYPMFNTTTDLLECFNHNKTYICEAVSERFPFLNGLHDFRLLPYIQLLKLQADKRSTKEVLYDALSQIQTTSDIESLFAYVFQKFFLKMFPDLQITLNGLNAALSLDICLPSPVSCTGNVTETQDQHTNTPIKVTVKDEHLDRHEQNSSEPSTVEHEGETIDVEEQDYNEPTRVVPKDEIIQLTVQDFSEPSPGADDVLPHPVRKCRLQPISYSEPPDIVCELNNHDVKYKAPEQSKYHKPGRRKTQECNNLTLMARSELMPGTKLVTVKLEFPKQVFNDKFKVRCGNKTGIFKKAKWTGHSSKDLCIRCDGKRFSVTSFERYGGRGSCKNWKKTINCERIKLETLFKAGILKHPIWIKKSTSPECNVKSLVGPHQLEVKKAKVKLETRWQTILDNNFSK
ncbi:uncharacterized protein LOC130353397 isoform X3 [Hyla sarda]|uniref:uncharacterized protein LOC130353397 isoform X3 n=1 Tax=Hyla sarda TaxID=327740 RepID=UPI0024C39B15|nr:uncharacterized protein LOC130353397 isoform X3 [Hyla sarda]